MECKSTKLGDSSSWFFCETTPMILFPLFASCINLIDLSRPTVIGITTPGKSTLFRKGKIGSSFGNS